MQQRPVLRLPLLISVCDVTVLRNQASRLAETQTLLGHVVEQPLVTGPRPLLMLVAEVATVETDRGVGRVGEFGRLQALVAFLGGQQERRACVCFQTDLRY